MPKQRKQGTKERHNPLAVQILQEEDEKGLRKTPRAKVNRRNGSDEEDGNQALPSNVSKKVMDLAAAQKADENFDFGEDALSMLDGCSTGGANSAAGEHPDMSDVEVDEEGLVTIEGANEEDERALSLFLPKGGAPAPKQTGLTLGDIILKKIQENEEKKARQEAQVAETADIGLSPKVIQVYAEIGKWLSTYKIGKIPKAFKVVPKLANWEEVLALTKPLSWSPAAMYEATCIFASNLNQRMAQRFYNLVLLPAIRQNIQDFRKLNFHYYRSLRKAIFKPAGFFKGIVLPLASEDCTLREAALLSSVLAKTSIPVMHVAATMVRLCVMSPWYGTTSILLATLFNKKYALPLQVIEHSVAHFCAFHQDERILPLVWHRAMLIFAQRYKFDLSEDQKKRLRDLMKIHYHEGITTEIRRELNAPRPGEIGGPSAMEM